MRIFSTNAGGIVFKEIVVAGMNRAPGIWCSLGRPTWQFVWDPRDRKTAGYVRQYPSDPSLFMCGFVWRDHPTRPTEATFELRLPREMDEFRLFLSRLKAHLS